MRKTRLESYPQVPQHQPQPEVGWQIMTKVLASSPKEHQAFTDQEEALLLMSSSVVPIATAPLIKIASRWDCSIRLLHEMNLDPKVKRLRSLASKERGALIGADHQCSQVQLGTNVANGSGRSGPHPPWESFGPDLGLEALRRGKCNSPTRR